MDKQSPLSLPLTTAFTAFKYGAILLGFWNGGRNQGLEGSDSFRILERREKSGFGGSDSFRILERREKSGFGGRDSFRILERREKSGFGGTGTLDLRGE